MRRTNCLLLQYKPWGKFIVNQELNSLHIIIIKVYSCKTS